VLSLLWVAACSDDVVEPVGGGADSGAVLPTDLSEEGGVDAADAAMQSLGGDLHCGVESCRLGCCTSDDRCGQYTLGTTLFTESCVPQNAPALPDPACPDSGRICSNVECKVFEGCRTEQGECGYKINIRDEVHGADEVISGTFNLGCVAPSILRQMPDASAGSPEGG
jgi:hypothetical protein